MRMKSLVVLVVAAASVAFASQQSDAVIKISQGERVAIALPDFRGSGEAQKFMDAFNQVLFSDLEASGLFRMVPKTMYPLETPQRPEDFRPPLVPSTPPRRGAAPQPVRQGPWLTDWSDPPVSATYLAFGYSGAQDGRLVVFGQVYNVTQRDLANAQVLPRKMYFGTLDQEGARKTAHEFAADIMAQFGYKSLLGTKIYFESNRGGSREIWSMDPDGSNQKQLTFFKSIAMRPAVSPDGTVLAFTTDVTGGWMIRMQSLVTGGRLPFYNPAAPQNVYLDFTPDGKRVVFNSNLNIAGGQLYTANVDGSDLQRLTFSRSIDTEPRVNPKTGNEIVFVSGRSGMPQIYKMNMDGADVQRLTDGEGEAVNPAWHPNGQHIAFSWTKGFAPGNFNIFIMDVATRQISQLTFGAGRNESPAWAPDGRHLVFSSNRDGGTQIWTMLADGTQVQKLTTQGQNLKPVWK